jgi:hypothetical protein
MVFARSVPLRDGESDDEFFDWVSLGYSCSVTAVMRRLFAGATKDVAAAQAHRDSNGPAVEFRIEGSAELGFSVRREGRILDIVRFWVEDGAIRIEGGSGEPAFRVTPKFHSGYGHCQLMVADQEYMEWQVRSRALAALFFNTQSTPQR